MINVVAAFVVPFIFMVPFAVVVDVIMHGFCDFAVCYCCCNYSLRSCFYSCGVSTP